MSNVSKISTMEQIIGNLPHNNTSNYRGNRQLFGIVPWFSFGAEKVFLMGNGQFHCIWSHALIRESAIFRKRIFLCRDYVPLDSW